MDRIPRQFSTQEFKEEGVQLVVNGELSVAKVGRRLNLSPQTLHNWINSPQAGKLKAPGSRSKLFNAHKLNFEGLL